MKAHISVAVLQKHPSLFADGFEFTIHLTQGTFPAK